MLAAILGALKASGAFLITPGGMMAGAGALLIAYILKKIDNKWVYNPIYTACYGVGVLCTVGLSKWTWTRGIWNKTVEPFIVDLLDNIISAIRDGLFEGLHSDNK